MSKHPGEVDHTNYVTLRPHIVRAYWTPITAGDAGPRTVARVWNGARVGLTIETRWVPDGAQVDVAIYAERGPAAAIEELPAAKVQKGRCRIQHKIAWTHEQLAELPADGKLVHFHFVPQIQRFDLTARSNALYVDLGAWSHSS